MENLKVNTIVKEKFKDEFTRMHNQIARNPLLSLKAKGLLLTIMSLPDDWVLHISQLPDFCKESKTSVRSAFNELKENGFIISVEMRDGKGRFKGNNYIAYYHDINHNIDDIYLDNDIICKISFPLLVNRTYIFIDI